jgi:3-hydroxybutyrate dehydrogenase
MLKGKVAVVTGSTSGIGLGVARALAAEGCAIMLNGFGDKAAIDKLQRDLAKEHGVKVAYLGADMSKPAEIGLMIASAERELGACDILVNNAGIQHVAPIEEFPDDKWDAIIAINLSAAFHATKAALPGMKKRRWGRIVNIASAHGLVASAQKVGYVAAKHGLVGVTKVTAVECANDGITCNAICPGWVLTPLVERQLADRAKQTGRSMDQTKEDFLREKQPMLAFSTPESIGALTVFLCGDAGATITGSAYSIDGGWVAQ